MLCFFDSATLVVNLLLYKSIISFLKSSVNLSIFSEALPLFLLLASIPCLIQKYYLNYNFVYIPLMPLILSLFYHILYASDKTH